jgi:hypothetical protein
MPFNLGLMHLKKNATGLPPVANSGIGIKLLVLRITG